VLLEQQDRDRWDQAAIRRGRAALDRAGRTGRSLEAYGLQAAIALTLDPALRWTRLAVLETRGGGLFDTAGTVRFRAVYVQEGKRGVLAETSRFIRQDGRWAYLGPAD
jgi:uncharacterized protein YchJ